MAVDQGMVVYSSPPGRSQLALAAADAIMCVWFASAWVHFAAYAAVAVMHAVCGDHCGSSDDTAWAVAWFAAICSLLVCTVAMAFVTTCTGDAGAEDDMVPATATPRRCEAAIRKVSADTTLVTAIAGALGAMAFFILVPVGTLMKGDSAVKGSREERTASALVNVGFLGMGSLFCVVVLPSLALRAWRMRRAGWRWSGIFEEKPSRPESTLKISKETQVLPIC